VSDWPEVRLGDVCVKITDGTHHSPANGAIGDFKYITAKNIKPLGLDLVDITYVDARTHAEIYSRCDVRRDDILYVKDGATTGRVALNTLDEPFSLLSSVGVLRPGPRVTPRYLLYVLQERGVRDRMLANMAGVAISRLTLKKLNDAVVPLAPLERQTAIVAEIEKQFSRLDEAVANLQRVKANLRRSRAATLRAASEGSLVDGTSACAWRRTTVGEVGQVISGLTKNPKRAALPRKLPYLRVANVYANELRLDDIEYIGIADHELDKLLVRRGDLLVVEGNGSPDQIGRVALWDGSISDCVHQNHLIKVRLRDDVLPQWAMTWLLSPGGRREIERVSSSTSGLHTLSTGKVGRLPIPVPPLAEQHRIVAEVDRRLSIVSEVEAEVERNLKRAQALRQAVLARAFGQDDRSAGAVEAPAGPTA
jgi:type I restriction enzyme S subunit